MQALSQLFAPIADWSFYAAAVPAVLLLGISKSGFGTGFGALAVPIMALVVSVPEAAAILMPLLLVMDLLGMAALRRDFDARLLRFLLPFALAGVGIGALLFRFLEPRWVAGIVGVLTMAFLMQRLFMPPQASQAPPSRWAGIFLTMTSGFTSFVAHAGGPPIAAYLIPQRLPPLVYTATLAFLFFFINLAKWVPYAWLGLFDVRTLSTALLLLPLAPLGVWLGVRIASRMDPQSFYRLVYLGMFLTACKLIADAVLSR